MNMYEIVLFASSSVGRFDTRVVGIDHPIYREACKLTLDGRRLGVEDPIDSGGRLTSVRYR
jgi:hypothetical protein